MAHRLKYFYSIVLLHLCFITVSQNENSKWYFGDHAALDFMTDPPGIITTSAMFMSMWMPINEGTASVADSDGNLLFYTDGMTIWNRTNSVMVNGGSLFGNGSTTQSALIVKQPGNPNIYFVFTLDYEAHAAGFRYTIVDMSLAGGMGAVTVKNVIISGLSSEKLCATRHCNGTDMWIITHEYPGTNFRADLLTSAGLSPTPVLSSIGLNLVDPSNTVGAMKISPSGTKLGLANYWGYTNRNSSFELFDFDNTTGVISNRLILGNNFGEVYWCEFSPDGTKFYGTMNSANHICQWDLCAGSDSATAASLYTISSTGAAAMQAAPNGKIYVCRSYRPQLGVINNPNAAGAACNYVDFGQSVAPNQCTWGIVNLAPFKPRLAPFTYTFNPAASCLTAFFTAPTAPASTITACTSVGYSLTNLTWSFGDPASGANNISTSATPSHKFSAPGIYTTTLIYYYTCGGGTDTLRQQIIISQAALDNTATFSVCPGTSLTLTAPPAASYTWNTGELTEKITVTPTASITYTVNSQTPACINMAVQAITVKPIPTVSVSPASTVICDGHTVKLSAIGNGESHTWLPPAFLNTNTGTLVVASPPALQSYTVIAGLNGCTSSVIATVSVLPLPDASISALKQRLCLNEQVTLQGFGGQYYSWAGPANNLYSGQTISFKAGNIQMSGIYNLTVTSAEKCSSTATTALIIDPLPNGSLRGKIQGCAPLCTDLKFLPVSDHIKTSWQIETETFSSYAFSFCFNKPGRYLITGTLTDTLHQCIHTNTLVAEAFEVPSADFVFSPLKPVEDSSNVIFSNSSKGENITGCSWLIKDISDVYQFSSEHVNYRFIDAGTYPVMMLVKNNRGCQDTAIKTITVEPDLAVYVPNAFSPNNDGINDTFYAITRGVKQYSIIVLNRWGEQVFSADAPENGWNGFYKDKPCKQDVYYWKINATGKNGKTKDLKGSVLLLRAE